MKNGKFLNSKIGKRLFIIFCTCALVPLILNSAITFIQVKKQLAKQSEESLQISSKSLGMAVFERMLLLSSELKRLASVFETFQITTLPNLNDLENMFVSLLYKDSSDKIFSLINTKKTEKIPLKYIEHLQNSEKISVFTHKTDKPLSRVFIVMPIQKQNSKPEFFIGEINSSFLWKIGSETILPPQTELIVIDNQHNIIVSSVDDPESCIKNMQTKSKQPVSARFEWSDKNNKYIARYWTIFMQSRFDSESWTVILSRDKNYLFSSAAFFQKIFLLVIGLSFLIVTFFSMVNIRLILVPLEKLKSGISEILNNNLKTRINVKSNDEFEEVAGAFNNMTAQLERQFKTILTNSEIDRAILSSLEPEIIISKMLFGLDELLLCTKANICIIDRENRKTAEIYSLAENKFDLISKQIPFDEQQIKLNLKDKKYISITKKNNSNFYLNTISALHKNLIIIPVFIKQRLEAVINLKILNNCSDLSKDIENTLQLADQMAVALANSNLVDELDQMAEGTLRALARTVDANSPWTAGHSERVSEMCLKLGEILGLDKERLHNLTRAALLHDIGKIGISTNILDKKGRLSDEEYEIIKQHPLVGASILEPIKVYKKIVPIVLQHHEQFDGNGYPYGLSGNEIIIEARIMAVADVYDALISDRPYRKGWEKEKVIDFIKEKSGSHFDPRVVKAFDDFIKTP